MSNHAACCSALEPLPSASVLRRLLTGYALSFNLHRRRRGHFFQNRSIPAAITIEARSLCRPQSIGQAAALFLTRGFRPIPELGRITVQGNTWQHLGEAFFIRFAFNIVVHESQAVIRNSLMRYDT
jgi:hypothetical protein